MQGIVASAAVPWLAKTAAPDSIQQAVVNPRTCASVSIGMRCPDVGGLLVTHPLQFPPGTFTHLRTQFWMRCQDWVGTKLSTV
jgi:hypothetical protein